MRAVIWSGRKAIKTLIGVIVAVCVAGAAGLLLVRAVANGEGGRRLPIYSVETEKKAVAVTFNCAWDDADIPQLLDILKERDIKATFFLLGTWAEKYPDSARAIAAAGHERGNHSNTHPDMAQCGKERICEEISGAEEKIFAATGERTVLFRAPSGSYNNLLVETAAEMGYKVIQWDDDSIDWKDPAPEDMTKRVLGRLQNGSIILFHSGAKNTPAALPGILDGIAGQGYQFLTVSEMVYAKNYTIAPDGRQKQAGGA